MTSTRCTDTAIDPAPSCMPTDTLNEGTYPMHQLVKKKPEPKPVLKRRWVRLTSVLLMLIAAYGLYRAIRPDPNLKKVKQLREEFAQAKDWTPDQRRDKGREMRDAMQKLSPSQREALAKEGQQRFQAQLEQYAK